MKQTSSRYKQKSDQRPSAGRDRLAIAPSNRSDSADAFTIDTGSLSTPQPDRHAPHEAWHVAQRKQARAATTNASSASTVVQRWDWPWNWGKKKKEDPRAHYSQLSESDRQAAEVLDNIAAEENTYRYQQNVTRTGPSYEYATSRDVRANRQGYEGFLVNSRAATTPPSLRSKAEKAQTASSGVSKLGTFATHLGQVKGNEALGTTGRLVAGSGGGLGFTGSLLEAGLETHDIITSHDKYKDKAIRSIGVVSPLANAVNSGASGVSQVADLVSGTSGLSSLASTVAAPAAIAKGGSDVITGLVSGGLAHYRSNRLQEMQTGPQGGIARFASESQWNKAKSNYGKAAGGALSVAGGALLLAAGLSNPVGWALLAGAGLIGGGLALYRMYKKHKQGKQLAQSGYQDALRANGINVPTNEQLGRGGWGDIFKTKSMRRQEIVRGQIANRLAESEDANTTLQDIGGHLGISRLDPFATPLREEQRRKQKQQRARSYARALDY